VRSFYQTSTPFVKSPYCFSEFNPKNFPLFPAGKGWRHSQLVAFAGSLRYHGAEESDLSQQLTEADRQFNFPQVESREIFHLVESALKWKVGKGPTGPSTFDIAHRALGWLGDHCFDPFFSGKGGCVTFAVLYSCIAIARKANSIDFNASCRDVALESGCTPLTASRALRRLCHVGYLKRVGHRRMADAQRYSLGGTLCLYPPVTWVELTSAMFRVSRSATKLQLCCGSTWQTPFDTRNAPGPGRVRVSNRERGAARRILRRKGLDSLEKAEDDEWRLKMMLHIKYERKIYADFVWRVQREKRAQRGKAGKLILMKAA
jgi:hypothetical protein